MESIGTTSRAELLAAFLEILAHDLRTPLSVISSDLAYVSKLHGQESVKNGLVAISHIAQMLNSLERNRAPEAIPNASQTIGALIETLSKSLGEPTLSTEEKNLRLVISAAETATLHDLCATADLLGADTMKLSTVKNLCTITTKNISIPTQNDKSPLVFNRIQLNRPTERLTLVLAELSLRLAGIQFAIVDHQLVISVPLWRKTES